MCDLSRFGRDRPERIVEIGRLAVADGCDVVHAQLLDGEDLVRLSAHGLPTMITVHNARAGWQAGQADVQRGEADLVVACAMAVEDELRETDLAIPLRTVWNGIDATALGERAGDPASVKFVIDSKSHFGARLRFGEVRPDSDNVSAVFASPARDQCERLARVAIVTELRQ
jgi:hypothetical protein